MGVVCGSGWTATGPRRHHAVDARTRTVRWRTSRLVAVHRVEGHGRRLDVSRAVVSRGVGMRRSGASVRTGGGANRRRTAGEAAAVATSLRCVAVSRASMAAHRRLVAAGAATPGVIRAGTAVAVDRAVSPVVVRRRATADLVLTSSSQAKTFAS